MDIEKVTLHKISVEIDRKLKKYRDNNRYSVAVLMDISKVFNTTNYDLLLAKRHAYGVRGYLL